MRENNPVGWFKKTYCSVCKNQVCKKSTPGVYVTAEDNTVMLPCILSMMLMSQIEHSSIRQYRKEKR
jgi:hypothetical protein